MFQRINQPLKNILMQDNQSGGLERIIMQHKLITLWCVELCSPPTDSWGLDESSEDSDEFDHAVPFSNSSWRRSMFCMDKYRRRNITFTHSDWDSLIQGIISFLFPCFTNQVSLLTFKMLVKFFSLKPTQRLSVYLLTPCTESNTHNTQHKY